MRGKFFFDTLLLFLPDRFSGKWPGKRSFSSGSLVHFHGSGSPRPIRNMFRDAERQGSVQCFESTSDIGFFFGFQRTGFFFPWCLGVHLGWFNMSMEKASHFESMVGHCRSLLLSLQDTSHHLQFFCPTRIALPSLPKIFYLPVNFWSSYILPSPKPT